MFGTPLAVYKGMFTGTDPRRIVTLMMSMLLMGCAGATIIPPDLKGQVEKNLSLADVKGSPLSHKGRFMAVGGMVLTVTPTKRDETKIEILELPLSGGYEPTGRLPDSRGRFLAFHKKFIDPATLPAGTPITIVGEVTGSVTLLINEVDYSYPTFEIKSLTTWSPQPAPGWWRPYPYVGAYWGPYWRPYWGPPRWVPWPAGTT